MDSSSLHTTQLHEWIDRMRAGDVAACEELLRTVGRRLEALARLMLRTYPIVRRHTETDDVLQSALMRLVRSLAEVRPESTRAFYQLAALQIRRELIDLARYYRTRGMIQTPDGALSDSSPAVNPSAPQEDPADLERWTRFHQTVENLPGEEREVVELIFYHEWKQGDVAELLGITERTVRRRWQSALAQLHGILKEPS